MERFVVNSESMAPAFYAGDYATIDDRLRHNGVFERGDVVLVRRAGEGGDRVRRIIGVPGDIVDVRGSTLMIKGMALKSTPLGNAQCEGILARLKDRFLSVEPVCKTEVLDSVSYVVIDERGRGMSLGTEEPRPIQRYVGPDSYFVMNDYREFTTDSRTWGTIHKKFIKGIVKACGK